LLPKITWEGGRLMRRLAGTVVVTMMTLGIGAAHASPGRDRLPGTTQFLGCKKLPAGSPAVKLAFDTATPVSEVITYMSNLSCTPLVLGDDVATTTKVTLTSAKQVTVAKAYALLHEALKAAGLAIVPASDRLQVVKLDADAGGVARRPVWVRRTF
jgi:hypothetical protein